MAPEKRSYSCPGWTELDGCSIGRCRCWRARIEWRPTRCAIRRRRWTSSSPILATVIDAVAPDTRRATIVGESFGGALALSFALARPEQVNRLVVLNSFPHFTPQIRLHLARLGAEGTAVGRDEPRAPAHRIAAALASHPS